MKQKHWQVSVFEKTIEIIKDDLFYTTDTEAYLVFELIDEDFKPDSAMVTVYNIYGTAIINVSVEVADGIVRYEMPEKAIRHPGGWRTQVVFTKDGEDYTTRIIEFDVGGHLLDSKKPPIVEIENWNSLIKHAEELIDDWEQLEEIRQANEQQRESAESARQTTFETNESTRQSDFETNETSRQTNELVREEAESNRQSEFEENELARESAESVRVANESERISKDSERDSKIEAVEGLQADLISGAVDSAAVQQHVEERYGQLEEEYAPKLTEVTTQLALTKKLQVLSKMKETQSQNRSTLKGSVTFIDDDGYDEVLSFLKPLFTYRNAPMGIALIGENSQILNTKEKREETKDLQDNHGWEILSHTMSHIRLGESTDEDVKQDSVDFLNLMTDYGLDVSGIVYPWGSRGNTEVVSKYYSYGFDTRASVNTLENTDNYRIRRFGLGSDMLPDHSTLEQHKSLIDKAIDNGEWIVYMTHVGDPNSDHQLIEDVLDYAISSDIDILTPSEGVQRFGSIVSSSDFSIKPNGLLQSNKYLFNHNLTGLTINPNDAPSKFPIGISVREFSFSEAQGYDFPTTGSGTLTTTKNLGGWYFATQIWIPSTGVNIHIRSSDPNDGWRAWSKLITEDDLPVKTHNILNTNVFSEDDSPSSYPIGESIMAVSNWSIGSGTVKTMCPISSRQFQVFYGTFGAIHTRANSGDGWRAWKEVQTV